ncbi:MAG TPA: PH domain-containing protein [Jatrophihabitans sp.]|jgi:membrane protein YdbS with pleckstrin-like domain|nr:PH domain-containing protein [Jatrophihabitans sp.]
MKDHDKYLIPSERAVVVTHRHWASLMKVGAGSAAVFLLAMLMVLYLSDEQFFAVVGVLALLGSLGWFGFAWWFWATEEFVITDKRVLIVSGIITRRVAIMPLTKVTDLTYERSLLGRLLGYGVFVMESAGQHQAMSRIEYLPRPDRLYHDVSTLLFGPDSMLRLRRRPDEASDHPTTPLPPAH